MTSPAPNELEKDILVVPIDNKGSKKEEKRSIRNNLDTIKGKMNRFGNFVKSTVKPRRFSKDPVKKPPPVIKISSPNGMKHTTHMRRDSNATWGIAGLPEDWKKILQQSGITKERFLKDEVDAIKVIQFVAEGVNNKRLPLLTETQLKEKMNATAQVVERNPETVYQKEDQIGEGAGGVVFKIKKKTTGATFAVKISPKEELGFIKSEIAYHALSDNHRNIVNYHETFLWKEDVWIVMDFVNGGCLTDILGEDNPKEWTESLISYVMHECLQALLFMHNQHLLHRDIKSDNVLVDRDGTVKLADFGFACGLSQEKSKRKSVVGTPFWMAPEVIEGKEYDDRCDVWSLGVTAIELVNHEPPHMDKQQLEALLDIVTQPSPMPNNPEVWSEKFLDFLQHSLEKEFENRATAAKLLEHEFLDKKCGPEEFSMFVNFVLDKRKEMETESQFDDEE